ncbi:MAG: exo-beta-N-acetylmuramidase NamZ domain-containing protein [Candidatus Methylacidiphilaceae bacterium]
MERFLRFWFGFLFLLSALPCALQAGAPVDLGIDVLAKRQFRDLQGKRVGLITNASGVNKNGTATLELLLHAPGVRLTAIFAPEHGLDETSWAGEKVDSLRDPRSGLPIHSLFGETRKPTPEMLRDVDILVFDVQDIGCRSYTYISTLGLAMEAAAENGKEFCVLDRPNPLGGVRCEGMPLEARFRSFVGEWDVPYVYGLTIGELAKMIAGEQWISKRPSLTVVPMNGWRREMIWEDTGLLWVPPSPNLPQAESAFFYVLTGLLGETAGVNNGVGTPLPFARVGSPDLDPYGFARALSHHRIAGVVFRPTWYRLFGREAHAKVFGGVQLHLRAPREVPLVLTALVLLEETNKALNGSPIAGMRAEDASMFDKLCGGDAVRLALQQGRAVQDLWESWEPYLEEYRTRRQKYLLYPETVARPFLGETGSGSQPVEAAIPKAQPASTEGEVR